MIGGRALKLYPSAVFATLSLLFGSVTIVVTPPLRGHDETSHFLRAYGVAQGDIVPSLADHENRKGIVLPPRLYEGFDFFETARVREKEPGFRYRTVLEAYLTGRAVDAAPAARFVPYAGSEGYSPIAYLPQSAAALISRALDLTFLPTLYLMRLAGLLVFTAVIAWAIAGVPAIRWPLVAIALLPAALYGRCVISADGSALAGAMVVVALWLRGIVYPKSPIWRWQPLAMFINALTKAPNVALVLLELRLWGWWRDPGRHAVILLPAMAAAALWTFVSGAETATWRMVEITGRGAEAFDPFAKVVLMVGSPGLFPAAVLGSLDGKSIANLWYQTIGVLGLFDTVLLWWIYPVISLLVLASFLCSSSLPRCSRFHVTASAAATTTAYIAIVYLISYLVFTPSDATTVWGVQGRYFIPVLPLLAAMVAALKRYGFHGRAGATLAIASGVISGCATVEAILRTDWFASVPG